VVEGGARVIGSIVGPDARIGANATLRESVIGEGAVVPAGSVLEGARISAARR